MSIAAVEKAFCLLEFLVAENRPITLSEAATACHLPKPSAVRMLETLQKLGYVGRPPGRREYFVGPRAPLLGASDPHQTLKEQVRPLLVALHTEFNETVNLGVLSGTDVLYVDFLETTRPLRMIVTPGHSDTYFHTALGRSIASRLPDKGRERLLAATRFVRRTGCTVKSAEDLTSLLVRASRLGYAEEIEESVEGVACLACSLNPALHPSAAISVSLPVQRYKATRRTALIRALKEITYYE